MWIFWEIRVGLRSLRRSPGYLLAVILPVVAGVALATAIVTTAIRVFSSAGTVQPDGEVRVLERASRESPASQSLTRRDVEALGEGASSTDFAAFHQLRALVRLSSDVRTTGVALVSGSYFPILGVGTKSGVVLGAEDVSHARRVAVISDALLHSVGSQQPGLSALHIEVNGVALDVAGVVRSGFRGTDAFAPVDVWIPLSLEPDIEPAKRLYERPDVAWLSVLCRVSQGARLPALSESLAARLGRQSGERALRVRLVPLSHSRGARPFGMFLVLVGVGVAALLLVTCTNVAMLMVARSTSRIQQRAIRVAIGCSRWRSWADVWIEGGLLALVAAVLGAAASFWIGELLIRTGPVAPALLVPSVTPWITMAVASTVAALIGILCVTSAVLFVPGRGRGGARVFTSGSALSPDARGSRWFVVVQLSVACVLLFVSSLVLRTTANVARRDLGFEPTGLFVSRVERGAVAVNPTQMQAWGRRLLVTIKSKQGMQDATLAAEGPLSSGGSIQTVAATGQGSAREITAGYDMVGPDYCRTTRLRLLAGRDLTEHDDQGAARVVLVNESLAKALWPGQSAVGQTVRIATVRGDLEVVGVTADSVYQTLVESSVPFFYLSVLQVPSSPALQLLVRATQPPAVVDETLATVGRELAANYSIGPAQSLSAMVRSWTATANKILAWLVTVAIVISLLAGYGVYSLNSYTLETRRRELAITVAMGASARQVVGSVLENAARNAAISFCAGVVLAFAAGGLFRHVLYGVAPLDPVSLVASAAALSIIGVGACVPPALRASRVDPASVLKEQ